MFVCPELHALKAGAGQAGVGVEEQVVGGFGASPGGVRVAVNETVEFVIGVLGVALHINIFPQKEADVAVRAGDQIRTAAGLVPIHVPAGPHGHFAPWEERDHLESTVRVEVEILQGRHRYPRGTTIQSLAGAHRKGDQRPVRRQAPAAG